MTSSDARRRCGAFALALMLTATSASADLTPAELDAARTLLRQGNELRAKDDLRGALAKYRAAHAIAGTPITALEVGRTHVALGELVEGKLVLDSVQQIPKKPGESENTTTARTEAARLATEVAPRIPTLHVVTTSPAGATAVIEIDGAAGSMDRKVNPGKHVIVVRTSTGLETRSEVTVQEGETREVPVSLTGASPSSSPSPTAPGGTTATETGRPTWIWMGFGVAAAGAIVGTVSGVLTLRGESQLADVCPDGRCAPENHDRLSDTRRWATISTISFAVAGTAAAVSIVGLLATGSKTSASSQGRITPSIGLGTVFLQGSF